MEIGTSTNDPKNDGIRSNNITWLAENRKFWIIKKNDSLLLQMIFQLLICQVTRLHSHIEVSRTFKRHDDKHLALPNMVLGETPFQNNCPHSIHKC